jgi:hypothetical protein
MPPNPDETEAETAQAALHASLERAHELVSEAKQLIRAPEEPEPQPPHPAN